VQSLLSPVPDDWLVADEVDKRVGDPRNDDPACLEPPTPDTSAAPPEQQSLF
jgi:putative SOS response-associated peptidase YedK